MNYYCAIEYAYLVKSLVVTTTPEQDEDGPFNDRGNKTMLERYIYINVLRELMQVIALYGLFPVINDHAKTYAPQLAQAYNYIYDNDDDAATKEAGEETAKKKTATDKENDFKALLYSMGLSADGNYPQPTNRVSFDLARSIKSSTFDKSLRQSILPIYVLQMIHGIKQSCEVVDKAKEKKKTLKLTEDGNALLAAGKYHGDNISDKHAPLNTLKFIHEKGVSETYRYNSTYHIFASIFILLLTFLRVVIIGNSLQG
jgi:hypothetical protein